MAVIAPFVFWQLFDNNGEPLDGGTVETYEAGTTTNKRTFADANEVAENTNPIVLDADGRADIWLEEGSYKFVLRDSAGVLIREVPNIIGSSTGVIVSYAVSANLNLTSIYENANIYGTGSFTINLLPAADAGDGFFFRVYNSGAGTITIDPNSSETINGDASLSIIAGGWAYVYCDSATNWRASQAPDTVGTLAFQDIADIKDTILGWVYPVGAYYTSDVSTSPATVLGFGTWSAVEGEMLIGADGTYTAGSTGGSATTTQTEAQMPSHRHVLRGTSTSGGVGAALYLANIVPGSNTTNNAYSQAADLTGSGDPMTTISPYRSVYIWRRTA